MSHLPARYAYQDSSPEQLWQLNDRSMLLDVQGGEFLLDDSLIDVRPPPLASCIPKPSANAHPKPVDDRIPRPAHPRPSMLPVMSKTIERGPQTARRRRINSTEDADETPVQLSIPLPETLDNMAPAHIVGRRSRRFSSRSRTQQTISPPEIPSPTPSDKIVVPPALPDFTSAHKRRPSTTNAAILPIQPKSILKRTKSTDLLQPLQPLAPEEDEVQVEPPRRQSARLSGFPLPELTHPPVPFSREPEMVYESGGAHSRVPLVEVEKPTAMEWEVHPGSHSIDLRMDQEDVFVDEAPVQQRSHPVAPMRYPEGPQPAVAEVLNTQGEGLTVTESLLLPPLRSSARIPPTRRVDADWEIEPLTEVPPEPENRSDVRSRRSSTAVPRLLSPTDLAAVELPVPPREVEVRGPEPRVDEPSVRTRGSSMKVPLLPEPMVVEKEQANQQPALPPQRASPPTALLPPEHGTLSEAPIRPKSKPSRPSHAPTRKERRESQVPVREKDQRVKAATSRPKETSEVPAVPLQRPTQVVPQRSLQKRTAPTPVVQPLSHPTSQGATNLSTGIKAPKKPKSVAQVAGQQSTQMTIAPTGNRTPSVPPSQLSRGRAAPAHIMLVPAAVPEPAVIPRPCTSIVASTTFSNMSATKFSVALGSNTESERVPDDMFERRKRDNYVAKPVGIDLTDHSTRGRGLDAVGSTSVNMSIGPNVSLSTSMPGEWVENSSVVIKRHERSRSIRRPPPSPILAKQTDPQGAVESESGEDEDSEDTEVGEVLEPERMKELTLRLQPDLTIEDLEGVPSLVRSFLSDLLQILIRQ
jgi:hypothetical protein